MSSSIACPNCGTQVEISQALSLQIEHEIVKREQEKFEKKLLSERALAIEESTKKIRRQFELELKQTQEDAAAKDERIKSLIEQITELTKSFRELKREKEEARLEMQKTLAEEEEKIRLEASKKAEEEQRLKILEKDKQLQDAMKEVEEMRRKLQQGSQQAQGEVFELEFENLLKSQYANDKVSPISKGVKGGDILQEVWDSRGNYAGKILWELKNTKTWSSPWVGKLKSDKREINAEEAVLISEMLPDSVKIAGYHEGIWVTNRKFVIPLADTLRAKLIQMYYVRNSVHAKDQKIEILYTYLSGTEFKHRVEAIIEAFSNMQVEIEKEKRYFFNKWARDEKNIRQVIDNTYGMHGDLKGIIGSVLPQIKGLELLESSEEQPTVARLFEKTANRS